MALYNFTDNIKSNVKYNINFSILDTIKWIDKNYNIIKSLRSHGWSRETTFHNIYKKKFKKLDDRFLFINSGYNLRPTDIQAAIAYNQFKRLNKFTAIRNYNQI